MLFVDVSGFTPLATRLAEHGSEGAEELNRILNAYFGQLVDLICDFGGDVVRFAGDAVLAIWPAEASGLAAAVASAAACGLAVQGRLRDFSVAGNPHFGPATPVHLALRINISAGELALPQVGGIDDKWQMLAIGPPLAQLRAADGHTRPGDVVLSPQARDAAADLVRGDELPDRHLRLTRLKAEPPPVASPAAPADDAHLRRYVPEVVLARLDAGQAQFIADLRQVAIVFLRFVGFDGATVAAAERLQTVMVTLQSAAQQFHGEVYQLVADDKGTVGILCFGLPHRTNDDNAHRAVLAAVRVQAALRQGGLDAGIGIATGKIFCGPIGSERRREYTLYGSTMNLAARLMQAAQADIFCDEATQLAAKGKFQFQELPPVKLKGFEGPRRVFRPVAAAAPAQREVKAVIGRQPEWEILLRVLADAEQRRPRVVLLQGEAGIGKSALTAAAMRVANLLGLTTHEGNCQAIEHMTPYFAWRSIVQRLLAVDQLPDTNERAARVRQRFEAWPEQARFAPLLNTLLAVNLPEDEAVSQLSGRGRAERLNELLVTLLDEAARERPLIVVLEDLHWLDSASWALVVQVAQRTQATLLCTLRPLVQPGDEYRQLAALPQTIHMHLEAVGLDDTRALAQDVLGQQKLSAALVEHLFRSTQGNPLYVEQLCCYLRDAGRLVVEQGECSLLPAAASRNPFRGRSSI